MGNVRHWVFAGVGLVAVAALAAGVWLISRPIPGNVPVGTVTNNAIVSPTPSYSPPDTSGCIAIKDVEKKADCQKAGYYLWSAQQMDGVIASGKSEDCLELESSLRDRCLSLLAGKNGTALCDRIGDTRLREQCQADQIGRGEDLAACDAITTTDIREGCQQYVVSEHRTAGAGVDFCDRFDAVHKAICVEWYWKSAAWQATDVRLCHKISDPNGVARCMAALPPDTDGDGIPDRPEEERYFTDPKKADTDGDGLDDYDEIFVYQTDPNKSDTDGDGYSDGQEVKNGFNPNGPGKLIK
ncbi:MAG: hypothetical protein PHI63_05550 [Patescibacteria group bacterium]|nr:hypothetical protein [Patescibacteria group bacterium]